MMRLVVACLLGLLCIAPAFAADTRAIPATAPYASSQPIDTPRLFGEGTISTPDDEFGGQFNRDGSVLFFNKSVPRSQLYTIFQSRYTNGAWSTPEVSAFSGIWRDFDATLAPDGERLFFVSDRPRADGVARSSYDIWSVQRRGSGWGDPENLGAPINGDRWSAHFASAASDGSLYFTSDRPGRLGGIDVWRARRVGDAYAEPENLGSAINGPEWTNLEAIVAPDQSFLIVSAYGHADTLGDSDLYVSFQRDGVWQPLQNLGAGINSAARDYSPRLTPDGRYLMFASERGLPVDPHPSAWTYRDFTAAIRSVRNGLGNLYIVDLAVALKNARASSQP
jgi:hypothetical protein